MATLSPSPKQQFFDIAGVPLVGGKLYTYEAGTTTPLATYTDSTGSTANTNPIILDVNGQADIWLANGVSYKFVLDDANDSQLWTVDNIDGVGSMSLQNADDVSITGGTLDGVTINNSTFNGNITGTADNISGVVTIQHGGTGAEDAETARGNLGLGLLATLNSIDNGNWDGAPLDVAKGGTGAEDAASAFDNIVAVGSQLTGTGYMRFANGLHLIWGSSTANANGQTTITYPTGVELTSWSRAVPSGTVVGTSVQSNFPATLSCSTTGFTVENALDVSCTIFWIAVGF